jgi:hypothetical protein
MRKIFLFILLFGLMLTITNCSKQKKNSFVTYEGKVLYLNSPAAGAIVTLKATDGKFSADEWEQSPENHKFEIANETTDANGHFYIHTGEARKVDYYWVSVYYNGTNYGINMNGYTKSELSSHSEIHIPN